MPTWLGRLFGSVILATALLPSLAAAAEGNSGKLPVAMIMVVDVQDAMQQSQAGRAVRSQRDSYVQSLQSSSEAVRRALKETELDLVRQKTTLAPEAWQQKARQFEQQVFEFNQRYQRNSQAVEKAFHAATQELSHALAKVTEEVASEMGATIVLPKSQIFLHDPRMEQTSAVVERLNRKFPSVSFPSPQLEGVEDTAKTPVKKK